MKFIDLDINEKLKKALNEIGFEDMMPIQEKTLPIILNGENIIGEAETGTGKTAAFVLPLLNKIDLKKRETQVLIVTPTRELAMQIVTEIERLGKYMKPSLATLVGGMSIRDQVKDLKNNPAIIVGTLGRIVDHMRNKKLNLEHVQYFVLDEADEMLKEGFKEDITRINKKIPQGKQTLLFSATISKQILSLSKAIMTDHQFVSVKDKNKVSTNIEQHYIIMKERHKFGNLTKLLDVDQPKSAIIFGRTKRRVDELNEALNKCGYRSVGIHGDLTQRQRNAVMKKFRAGQINILVATDVAARGLDINDITHVYNFDLPQEVEFYVHRIGRTGRAKKQGISYSFIREGELKHIKRIETEAKVRITEKRLPNPDQVRDVRHSEATAIIKKRLSDIDASKTKELANDLINEFGSERLVSVLIESLSKKVSTNQIKLTGEPPVTLKRNNASNKGYNMRRGQRDRNKSRDNKRPRRRSR